MESVSTDSLREELMNRNSEFRNLVREHGRYEERLSELASLQYPSDAEVLEESSLKKKKLAIKDQMQAMLLEHQNSTATSH